VAGLAGSLRASLSLTGVRIRSQPPLELRGPFPGTGYFLRNMTAGIFGGDAYKVVIVAEAGSTTRITSPSATKVYAANSRPASLDLQLTVESGATLVWGPHATIIQAGANLDQRTAVTIAPSGAALLTEVLVLGRLARGERYAFERLSSSLDVRDSTSRHLYSEACTLSPDEDLATTMAEKGVLASVYALGYVAANVFACLETLCLMRTRSQAAACYPTTRASLCACWRARSPKVSTLPGSSPIGSLVAIRVPGCLQATLPGTATRDR
jgi:urease accessory protein UreH